MDVIILNMWPVINNAYSTQNDQHAHTRVCVCEADCTQVCNRTSGDQGIRAWTFNLGISAFRSLPQKNNNVSDKTGKKSIVIILRASYNGDILPARRSQCSEDRRVKYVLRVTRPHVISSGLYYTFTFNYSVRFSRDESPERATQTFPPRVSTSNEQRIT